MPCATKTATSSSFPSTRTQNGEIVRGRRGRYLSTAWIPGNLLAEGMHYVSSFITTIKPETQQVGEFSIVAFHVVDTLEGDSARGGIGRQMPGAVRPLLEWSTQYRASAP